MRFPIAVITLALAIAIAAAFAAWWGIGRPVAIVEAPDARFPCLSYAPFMDDQTPFDENLVIPPAQIERDLRILAERTQCVRIYSVKNGLDAVVPIAAKLGMKVMLGAWVGWEQQKNQIELDRAVDLAHRYPETIAALIVGNEVLLRQEQPAAGLIALIEQARAALPASIPVTYADVWEFWLKNPSVADAVDFVTIHTLPYWEDDPVGIDKAVPHVLAIVHHVADAFPGKRIFIGEAGWPSAGRMREGALPSLVNQARFIRELALAAATEDFGLNLIESFDQPWKRRLEGTVGGHWGVYTEDRQPKFPLQGPVSNDPHWFVHFLVGAGLGFILIIPAFFRARRLTAVGWFALAAAVQAAGVLLVAGGLAAIDASLGVLDALVWGSRWMLAVAAVMLAGVALVRPTEARPALPCSIFQLLSWWRQHRPPATERLGITLGAMRAAVLLGAAVTTLCFLFDARYRDFPVALTALPAASFLAIAWVERRQAAVPRPGDDLREERLLALLIGVGGILVGLSEAPWNFQAWGLMGANLLLALAVWVEAHHRSGRLLAAEPQARVIRSSPRSSPAADSSGA